MSLSASGQVTWLGWYTGGMVVLIALLDHQPDSAQPVISTVKRLTTEEGHLADEQASTWGDLV